MSIQNIQQSALDPFISQDKAEEGQTGVIHIRIQQRNGRKTLTTVQGIDEKYDKRKFLKVFKKEFACNGSVTDHDEYGEVIVMQGDQRKLVHQFLLNINFAPVNLIKMHGF